MLQHVRKIKAERNQATNALDDMANCVVCCEAARAVVLFPCSHFCLCATCAPTLPACPMCRADIDERRVCIAS